MAIPLVKHELKRVVVETVRRNRLNDAYIKMYCTRGDGPPFINPKGTIGPTMVVFAVPPARVYSEKERMNGAKAIISSVRRIPPACGVEARIKQLNYMNNVMMFLEATDAGADIAIALDLDGYVTEGVAQNVFVVRDSVIRTPPPQIILSGITRRSIIELARKEGYKVVEEMLTPYDLYTADEVFVTATAASGGGGLIALSSISGRVIGEGKLGPITDALMKSHLDALRTEKKHLTPIYK
jgi:branched-chain amino acid aminotransferase